MNANQQSDSQEPLPTNEDDQQQIFDLVQAFMQRTEAIIAALSRGATFFEIEEYFDHLDSVTSQTEIIHAKVKRQTAFIEQR